MPKYRNASKKLEFDDLSDLGVQLLNDDERITNNALIQK